MNKQQFEHAIRAAGGILGENEVLIIGNQAIHASIHFRLEEAERSIEVDISSVSDASEGKADLIDGSIGELSIFQEPFGYYAQGVTPPARPKDKEFCRAMAQRNMVEEKNVKGSGL